MVYSITYNSIQCEAEIIGELDFMSTSNKILIE